MSPLATDNLAELIRKKHRILVQLREIARRQEDLVGELQASSLLQLLGAKQHLISALQMVERGLRPFQAEDPESRQWRSEQDRATCAVQSEACRELLAQVMDLEKQHEMRIAQRRDEVASQLQQASAAREAVDAYGQHRTPPAPMMTLGASDPIDLTTGPG